MRRDNGDGGCRAPACWQGEEDHPTLEDGLLHVFLAGRRAGLASGPPAGGEEAYRALRRVLGRILGLPAEEVPLGSDLLGRPRLEGSRLGLAVCRDGGRLTVALAAGRAVAVSLHEVPPDWGEHGLAPFTGAERAWAAQAADGGGRSERLARLWTRKEAALRLGAGSLATAGELDVLAEERDGKVALPEPRAGSRWVPAGAPGIAYVRDLAAGEGLAAAAATSEPVGGVRTWCLECAEVAAV